MLFVYSLAHLTPYHTEKQTSKTCIKTQSNVSKQEATYENTKQTVKI